MVRKVILVGSVIMAVVGCSWGAVPQSIAIQGKLDTYKGTSQTYSWAILDSTNAILFDTNPGASLPPLAVDANGIFNLNVDLGLMKIMNYAELPWNNSYKVRLRIGSPAKSWDFPLTTAPYAITAKNVYGGAVSAESTGYGWDKPAVRALDALPAGGPDPSYALSARSLNGRGIHSYVYNGNYEAINSEHYGSGTAIRGQGKTGQGVVGTSDSSFGVWGGSNSNIGMAANTSSLTYPAFQATGAIPAQFYKGSTLVAQISGATTTAPAKLSVAGSIEITGTGNGIKFPDGTIQTTKATGGLPAATDGATPRYNTNTWTFDNTIYNTGTRVGIGSVNPPAYTLDVAGDLNYTGTLRQGGTVLGTWAASGLNVYRSGGNVGIGTNSPGATLEVNGIIKAKGYKAGDGSELVKAGTNVTVTKDAANGFYTINSSSSSGSSQWTTGSNSVNDLVNTNTGNVGVGTTTPTQKFSVSGNVAAGSGAGVYSLVANTHSALNDTAGLLFGLSTNTNYNTGGLLYTLSDTTLGAGDFDLAIRTSGPGNPTITDSKLRVSRNGNVGIGTTTPSYRLNVDPKGAGGILIGNSSDGSGGYTSLFLGISALAGGYSELRSIKSAGAAYGDLILNADGGSVGVGTKTPKQKLHLHGSGGTYLKVSENNINGGGYFGQLGNNTVIQNQDNGNILVYAGGAQRLTLTPTGSLGIGTDAPPMRLTVSPGGVGSGLGIGWNATGSVGETDFYNYGQGGAGGYYFYNYPYPQSTYPNSGAQLLAAITSAGDISAVGNVNAGVQMTAGNATSPFKIKTFDNVSISGQAGSVGSIPANSTVYSISGLVKTTDGAWRDRYYYTTVDFYELSFSYIPSSGAITGRIGTANSTYFGNVNVVVVYK